MNWNKMLDKKVALTTAAGSGTGRVAAMRLRQMDVGKMGDVERAEP